MLSNVSQQSRTCCSNVDFRSEPFLRALVSESVKRADSYTNRSKECMASQKVKRTYTYAITFRTYIIQ